MGGFLIFPFFISRKLSFALYPKKIWMWFDVPPMANNYRIPSGYWGIRILFIHLG